MLRTGLQKCTCFILLSVVFTVSASYQQAVISSPVDQATLRNGCHPLIIHTDIVPSLQAGDSAELLLDGQLISTVTEAPVSFSLPLLDRGTHTLGLQLIEGKGKKVLIKSPLITVYCHQAAVRPERETALSTRK